MDRIFFQTSRVVILLAFFITGVDLYGQDVDPITGRAIINIPLGQISAFDMSAAVSLSHYGGALRVDESAGNAGMGWSVNTGGYVSREVRGLPDDYNGIGTDTRKGWLLNSNAQNVQSFTPSANDDLSSCGDELTDWNFINNLDYIRDTEPDVYYFEAPGISGKFIFGADGLPKLIPYQDLQITVGPGFTITTNTGVVYRFTTAETVTRKSAPFESNSIDFFKTNYNYYEQSITYTTTWNLTSVTSTTTGTIVNYSYSAGEEVFSTEYYSGIRGESLNVDTLFYILDLYSPMLLSRVDLKNYSIVFSWANEVINKITFNESETGNTKEYDFVYKDIASSYGNGLLRKPFLMQVRQRNSCVAFPDYKFTYHNLDTAARTIPIPWKTGWGQDYFGFYNGKISNKNIPTIYFYENETGARRFRVTPIPTLAATDTLQGISGQNMDVNGSYSKYGALISIQYPTGGRTSFSYEANKYFDASTGEELYGPGLRVVGITTSGGDAAYGKSPDVSSTWHELKKTYQYFATDESTTSGRVLYPPVLSFTDGVNIYRSQRNLSPGTQVLYGRVRESITGQGSRVYTYDLYNSYPDATADASSSKIARPSSYCPTLGLAKNGSYTFPYAPVKDTDFKRGFLTRVAEYTEAGALTMQKRYVYELPQSTGSSIKGLRYEAIEIDPGKTIFYYSTYSIPVSQSRILKHEFITTIGDESPADSTTTNVLYKYNSKNMLVRTTQTNDDNSVIQSNIKYAMNYSISSPAAGDIQAGAIKSLNTTNRYGEVIETYQKLLPYLATDTVDVGAQLNIFKEYGPYVWPYQQKHLPPGASLTVSTESGTTTQNFVADADYILDATIDFVNGLPVNQLGTSMIQTATHYSSHSSLPLASLVNCKAENAIYEGFEMTKGYGLTHTGSGPSSSVEARTGEKSLTLVPPYLLNSPSVTKSENIYRISVWAYASSDNINVTVKAKNAGATQATLVLNYPGGSMNSWKYLEGFLDMSTVSNSFSFEVSSSSSIRLDDFVAIPKSATIAFNTILPFTGVTSQTDDTGNSSVIVYDAMGRKMNVLDKNRDLVEVTEYGLQKQGKVTLNANFTADVTSYVKGQTVTFTAASTCISGVNYAWEFKDYSGNITTASGESVTKTFLKYGAHIASLTVSKVGYETQSFTDFICVNPDELSVNIAVSPSNSWEQCEDHEKVKTFTATLNWSKPGLDITYEWYVTDLNSNWITAGQHPDVVSGSGNQIVVDSPTYDYQVKCTVWVSQPYSYSDLDCTFLPASATDFEGIDFIPNAQCP